ncbi:MAG: polyribonucleotide nucleotidyltransferase [Ardenticatenaceae bacterium]|nr:polyribonucleotide nucleotidyltransferase [Ardenticatenaceae bacterium]
MIEEKRYTTVVGDQEITFGTGTLAGQAGGAVTIYFGDCMLLATATMARSAREGLDFFPLSVDYEEKLYAAGRIPGSFFRREGRATTDAVLVARLTDRPLRPLFPKGMRNEVQVIITTLSSDGENFMDVQAVNAASAALSISNIPWDGPVGAVRIGYIDGELIANPKIEAMDNSDLDLRIAGTKDAIIMVESRANEISEDLLVEALAFGHDAIQPLIATQEQMAAEIGKEKSEVIVMLPDETMFETVNNRFGDQIRQAQIDNPDRHVRRDVMNAMTEEIVAEMTEEDEELDPGSIKEAINTIVKKSVRDRILNDRTRPDGRDMTTIRELSSDIGISPRAHGSGLFKRGETQVMSIASLGTLREAQKLDGLEAASTKRFLHHYNFPPFSTGETWFLRGPKRREIGHGELARNALLPVIPSEEEFPYTIRVVSEVLSSNGSTSQGSVCASTLALMDCGVPIKRPVAGIAMGLISDEDNYAILTDIQGLEDHLGDMDFKVAGTSEGVTALQMDIKISGLTQEIMAEALGQARAARLEILENMTSRIAAPREELNKWAPRMLTIKINPEKIGAIIGKGGSTIRSLEEDYEVSIDIQEDGTIYVAGTSGQKSDEALRQIELLTKEAEVGQVYSGKVVRTTDFGAFIEILPGVDGMVHISQISPERINKVEDVLQLGDEAMVMVTAISPDGKVRLSRRAVVEGWTIEEAIAADQAGGQRRGGNRGGRGGNRRRR